MAWLDGWLYKKSITLSRASGAVTNYQMKLLLGESSGASGEDVDCGGKCLSSFNDIRFTTSDGETLLDYWIESISGTTPNQLATIWIEFDSIGTGATTFYMYYGNAGAAAASNGANTFPETFDHFDTGSLDTGKWTKRNGGTITFSGSEMTIPANASGDTLPGKLIAKNANTGNYYILRARFKVTSGTNADGRAGLSVKTEDDSSPNSYNYVVHDFTNLDDIIFLNDTVAWGTRAETSWAKNTYYIFEIYHDGTNVKARRDDGTWQTQAWSGRSGYLALNFGIHDEVSVWDWALVRKFVATEPAWGSWGAEEDSGIVYEDAMLYLAAQTQDPVRVSSLALEALSDDPCSHYTRVSSLALEALSDDPCSHYTRVSSLALEILSTEYVVSVADDARLELQAYYQELEDVLLYLQAAALAPLEDVSTWLRAHDGTEFNDALMYLYTQGYDYDNALMYLTTCIYELEDAALYLQAASSTVYSDALMYLTTTDGITFDDCSLYLTAVADVPASVSSVYQRLTSIISEV